LRQTPWNLPVTGGGIKWRLCLQGDRSEEKPGVRSSGRGAGVEGVGTSEDSQHPRAGDAEFDALGRIRRSPEGIDCTLLLLGTQRSATLSPGCRLRLARLAQEA
jgi:hypothetical protein